MITKLVGIYGWSILIGTSSNIHIGYFMDLSSNYNDILLTFISSKSSLLDIERGIRTKSHKALSKILVPIT